MKETKKTKKRMLFLGAGLLFAFALWTVAVQTVDVAAVGPLGSAVGFASMNAFFHRLTGVHFDLYVLTDWLGILPILVVLFFAAEGLCQWIGRRSLFKVDRRLFVLGAFYIAVAAAYLFFEMAAVNFRPVLISGRLEASYPSSTTLLSLSVMPSAWPQLRARLKSAPLRRILALLIFGFAAFMVIARLICGVHWLSDIIGGALLSGALLSIYCAFL